MAVTNEQKRSRIEWVKEASGILVLFGLVLGLVAWTLAEAKADGVKATLAVAERLDNHIALAAALNGDYERHKAEEAQKHGQLVNQVEEGRKDTKALYDAVMSGRRQERLEKPVYVDGGREGVKNAGGRVP